MPGTRPHAKRTLAMRPCQIGAGNQLSKATPKNSSSRQISRHLRDVRKPSKDNSKSSGIIVRSWLRMPAPRFVTSRTVQDCIPDFLPKNSSAPLMISVLPIDLRSFILKGVLNEFLVNPMAPVVAPPDFSKDEPAGDRTSGDKDGPYMPGLGPVRRRAHVQQVMMIAIGDHARPPKDKAAARDMIARRLLLFRTAAHLITVLSVSLSVRKARCGGGLGSSDSLAQVL